jgi:hypothetical protein
MADDGLWHLLIHTPGPEADPSVPFSEAPWFAAHRGFHAALREAGYFVAAGPLPERPGAGQTLVRGVGTEELTRLATETDPAVAGGFLRVEVVPWRVVESVLE